MKIICTKEEFAEMITNCYANQPRVCSCYGCVLRGICSIGDEELSDRIHELTDFCEIANTDGD